MDHLGLEKKYMDSLKDILGYYIKIGVGYKKFRSIDGTSWIKH